MKRHIILFFGLFLCGCSLSGTKIGNADNPGDPQTPQQSPGPKSGAMPGDVTPTNQIFSVLTHPCLNLINWLQIGKGALVLQNDAKNQKINFLIVKINVSMSVEDKNSQVSVTPMGSDQYTRKVSGTVFPLDDFECHILTVSSYDFSVQMTNSIYEATAKLTQSDQATRLDIILRQGGAESEWKGDIRIEP